MLTVVLDVLDDYKDIIEAQPTIKEVTDIFRANYLRMQKNIQIQSETVTGETKLKRLTKSNLASSYYSVASFVRNYAIKMENLKLEEALSHTQLQLNRMKGPQLIGQVDFVLEYYDSLEDPTPLGIPTEMTDTLRTDLAAFKVQMMAPQEARLRIKNATAELDQLYNETRMLIEKRMIPLFKACYAQSQIELWTRFQNSVQMIKPPTHHLAIKGSIRDVETKEPITKAWIDIPNTDISYRVRSKKGNFIVRNLDPGSYTIKCSHGNYQEVKQHFKVLWGETTKLVIEMQMDARARKKQEQKQPKEELEVQLN